ncbi:hypothetical protein, partial [Salmonella sp. SAL4435]|uniref:hypothetical protein n=1 Tax=Salmonella sp. SAL4435 TaxID=3159890 RepID=UPI00397D4054
STPVATIAFDARPRGELGVTFECRLDGDAWAACGSPLVTGLLADGEHLARVRARDAAGNVDETPLEVAWTLDTALP